MSKIQGSVVIDAPVEKVFAFALDVGKLWGTTSEPIAIKEVTLTPDGVGSSAKVWTHFLGIHMEGGIEYTEVVPNQRIVAKVHFAGEKPTWVFTFQPEGAGTKLTAEAEWHVDVPAVGKAYEGMLAKGHESMLKNWLPSLKAKLEVAEAA